jgi:2-phospho-L-lactate guanylyltransferase
VSIRAIVPQKSLAAAKSRLGDVLSVSARTALSRELLKRVLAVLGASRGIEEIVVMTPDPAVGAFAAACGVRAVPDFAPGLNESLAEVFRSLSGGSRGMLVIAADLPLLRPADISAALAAGEQGALIIAPSKDAVGTNALLFPPAATFRPAFGPGSLAAHRRRAGELGLQIVEVRRPGLAFDLDTPAELVALGVSRRSIP